MGDPLSIRIDPAIDARLKRLARLTGRCKSFYVKQAIEDHLEDLEDLCLAQRVAQRVVEGHERLIALDELERQIQLETSKSG